MRKLASQGFTLVEAIVSMLVISVAALAMASSLGVAFSHSSDSLLFAKSGHLAQAYIEEIQARRYDEAAAPGGKPSCAPSTIPCSAIGSDGETRTGFDDVDDYDGLDESPPRNSLDQVLTDYAGFRVQVSVSYASAAQVTAWQLDDVSDAKVVDVSITSPDGKSRSYSSVRANY